MFQRVSFPSACFRLVALAALVLCFTVGIPIQTAQAAPTTAVPKTTASTTQPDGVAMYRMYNMRTGEHLYTADANEKNVLKTRGWDYEGIGWYAPKKSSTPVYRLYSKRAKAHHYTTDKNERDVLSKKHGWTYEGVGWYSDDKKTIPIYRVYKASLPLVASHHFTYDKNERDTLVAKHKYKGEGVAWHALAEGQSVLDGWEKVDGKWRFYNEGTLLKDRWVVTKRPFSKKSDTGLQRYRIDAQGNLVTGFFKVDGASYYGIPAKGHVVRYSYKIDSTHALVADADGKLCQAKGWVVTNKLSPGSDLHRYYFEPTKANKNYMGAKIGFFTVGKNQYYGYKDKGYVVTNPANWYIELEGKYYQVFNDGHILYSNIVEKMRRQAQGYSSPSRYLLMVDIDSCKTIVFEGRRGVWNVKYIWPCCTGKVKTPTVTGVFHVGAKGYSFGEDHGYSCYYWTQIYGGYLFHSRKYYPGTHRLKDGRMERRVSNGCVRLYDENAIWIQKNAPAGTTIVCMK